MHWMRLYWRQTGGCTGGSICSKRIVAQFPSVHVSTVITTIFLVPLATYKKTWSFAHAPQWMQLSTWCVRNILPICLQRCHFQLRMLTIFVWPQMMSKGPRQARTMHLWFWASLFQTWGGGEWNGGQRTGSETSWNQFCITSVFCCFTDSRYMKWCGSILVRGACEDCQLSVDNQEWINTKHGS